MSYKKERMGSLTPQHLPHHTGRLTQNGLRTYLPYHREKNNASVLLQRILGWLPDLGLATLVPAPRRGRQWVVIHRKTPHHQVQGEHSDSAVQCCHCSFPRTTSLSEVSPPVWNKTYDWSAFHSLGSMLRVSHDLLWLHRLLPALIHDAAL